MAKKKVQEKVVKEEKKGTDKVKSINKLIKYYNEYTNYKVSKEDINKVRNDFFKRVFGYKDVEEVNEELEVILSNGEKEKIKDCDKLEDLLEILKDSKDTFDYLVYDKGKKKSYVLDIIGFIILSMIGIGFIYSGMVVFGMIFILCFVALYLVTFYKHER